MLSMTLVRGATFLTSLLLLAGVSAFGQGVTAAAPNRNADTTLEQSLSGLAAHHAGHVSLFARDLRSGRSIALDADRPVQTASVIKLALLYEAMEQVREGKVRWSDPISLAPGDSVSGSGLLVFLDAPLTLTLKDVLTLMVVVSDNTAANLAMDKLGIEATNARMTQIGLTGTHLYKKIGKPAAGPLPEDQPRFGLGKTTAREMEALMERIGRCELEPGKATAGAPVSAKDAAICEVALNMLRNQFYRETIPRYLESLDSTENGSGTASKTGSLNAVRNDVAIVAGKSGPIVLSIFTYDNQDHGWTVDNAAEVLIAKLAREIVLAWSPSGVDGKSLVPGLGLAPIEPSPASKANNVSSK